MALCKTYSTPGGKTWRAWCKRNQIQAGYASGSCSTTYQPRFSPKRNQEITWLRSGMLSRKLVTTWLRGGYAQRNRCPTLFRGTETDSTDTAACSPNPSRKEENPFYLAPNPLIREIRVLPSTSPKSKKAVPIAGRLSFCPTSPPITGLVRVFPCSSVSKIEIASLPSPALGAAEGVARNDRRPPHSTDSSGSYRKVSP